MRDALVVGAGPSGSRTALQLAEAGLRVTLVEEHPRVGEPCQCAGLVTPRTCELLGYRPPVLAEMAGARLWGPGGEYMQFGARETRALVIDRAALDRSLAERATAAGAELRTATRCTGFRRDARGVTATLRGPDGEYELRSRLLVGADGTASRVARVAGFGPPPEVLAGYGGEIRGYRPEHRHVDLFVGSRVAPRFFGWVIPTGPDTARVGLATAPPHSPRTAFARLFKQEPTAPLLAGTELTSRFGGAIPLGLRDPAYADRLLLVGDAAGMAKPTSGGGIYTGLISADAAAETAIAALAADDCSARRLARYQRRLRRRIGRELRLGARLRQAFLKLDDAQIGEIIALLGTPRVREVIERHGDIDYASRAALAVLKAQPKLVKFAPLLLHPLV